MEPAPTESFVTASDGLRLAVHSYGGAGPPLLILHCNGFCGRAYAPLAAALAPHVTVHSLDLRGHGASSPLPPAAELSWQRYAGDALAVVDALRASGACFALGHSLGGGTALLAEALRPGTFAGMFLFEPIAPPEASAAEWRARSGHMGRAALRRRPRFDSFDAAARTLGGKQPMASLDPACFAAYIRHGFRRGAPSTQPCCVCAARTSHAPCLPPQGLRRRGRGAVLRERDGGAELQQLVRR